MILNQIELNLSENFAKYIFILFKSNVKNYGASVIKLLKIIIILIRHTSLDHLISPHRKTFICNIHQ